ncbi:MAG: poly-beta-hydroxybutyrate polymerase N-terminal domain-containing protein, partial [Elioraea sp.]|nr:poly-beta-hydroxybutyrate polymerase N-terminal domain-containing protein [Elioraea sp.]
MERLSDAYDRVLRAAAARMTTGSSPGALALPFADWRLHLAAAPGRQAMLGVKAETTAARLATYAVGCSLDPSAEPCITPLPGDSRFAHPGWRVAPFSLYAQGFLLAQQWWHVCTHGVRGVSRHHEEVVSFVVRQILDVVLPSNWIAGQPEILERTLAEAGAICGAAWRTRRRTRRASSPAFLPSALRPTASARR